MTKTLVLFTIVYSYWIYCLFFLDYNLSTFIQLVICKFILFTPMHDSVHNSVTKTRWLNNLVGRLCGVCFFSPFIIFRYIHLEHHRHVNDENDPDGWSSKPWIVLRWLTQDLYYYVYYINHILERPFAEIFDAVCCIFCYLIFLYNYPEYTFKYFFLPCRISSALLACTFDYLPHRPHESTEKYSNTTIVSLYGDCLWPISWLFLYQNYHAIHHLYPYIPFHGYKAKWDNNREKLLEKGIKIRPIINL